MMIDLDDTDIIFIYGHFQKQLAEMDKISSAPDCPLDQFSIKNQKAPYQSVIEKLKTQVPNLTKMDDYF